MAIVFYVLLGLLVAVLLWTAYALARNERVYKFQNELLTVVSDLAGEDIAEGREWTWRYDAFNTSSYNEKAMGFKRLKASNYYDDLSFLDGKDITL
jgi:hypothetical protein